MSDTEQSVPEGQQEAARKLMSQAAFPFVIEQAGPDGEPRINVASGLSRRELFAAMALQGILADISYDFSLETHSYYDYASRAANFADALIQVLAVSEQK